MSDITWDLNDNSSGGQWLDTLLANQQELASRLDSANASADEYLASSLTPTYVDASNFTLAGDASAVFEVGRMVRATLGSGYVYAAVSAVSYSGGTGLTTVTLASAVLDNTLSAVSVGILAPGSDGAVPADVVRTTGAQSIAGAKTFTSPVSVGAAVAAGDAVQKAALDEQAAKALFLGT